MKKLEMRPFIWVYKKNSDESWFKANAMGVKNLNSLMKPWLKKPVLTTFTLRTTAIENE